jgi:hypothetical protein
MNVSEAVIGETYSTRSGLTIEVIEKQIDKVIVKSIATGNNVVVLPTYQITPIEKVIVAKEENMSETNQPTGLATVAEAKPKAGKLKKSNVVDDGLRAGLSVDDIVKNVLAAFPETPEKSVRNLVSVRRSKLKKTA